MHEWFFFFKFENFDDRKLNQNSASRNLPAEKENKINLLLCITFHHTKKNKYHRQ